MYGGNQRFCTTGPSPSTTPFAEKMSLHPPKPDAPELIGITAAAAEAGTGVQNLRAYESHGLLTPERTDGGTRRYSAEDVATLRHITGLLADGLNLAGIAMVLDLEAEVTRLRANLARRRGSR